MINTRVKARFLGNISGLLHTVFCCYHCQLQWVAISFSSAWKWKVKVKSLVSDSQWPHGPQPTRLLHPWDFSSESTGVGCHWLIIWGYFLGSELECNWHMFFLNSDHWACFLYFLLKKLAPFYSSLRQSIKCVYCQEVFYEKWVAIILCQFHPQA